MLNAQDMVIFDIGANDGSSCSHFADDPRNVVYTFEPTPHLLETYLYPKQKENYKVFPIAVSDFDGKATFNIAGQENWGCSSLNNFSKGLENTWPGRTGFKVTQSIEVDVIRMDAFLDAQEITQIDFLHCDVQGSDLKVLKSFGKYINILKEGEVEAFKQNPLYEESDNSIESMSLFLSENDFEIIETTPNDSHHNEFNIKFRKNEIEANKAVELHYRRCASVKPVCANEIKSIAEFCEKRERWAAGRRNG